MAETWWCEECNLNFTVSFFFFFNNNYWAGKSCQISPLLLFYCLFCLAALPWYIRYASLESLRVCIWLSFLSSPNTGWAECLQGHSRLLGWSHYWKKNIIAALQADGCQRRERENDRRSVGHRGERMTSEARFSTTAPSVHSAETRQSLAGLQLLCLSLLLSARVCKRAHVKIYRWLMMPYNKKKNPVKKNNGHTERS